MKTLFGVLIAVFCITAFASAKPVDHRKTEKKNLTIKKPESSVLASHLILKKGAVVEKKLSKQTPLDRTFLFNIYILHNDGCYYLGRVYLMDDGSLEWYNNYGDLSQTQGHTFFCMSSEEFSNFC